jgi:hypothetical protein
VAAADIPRGSKGWRGGVPAYAHPEHASTTALLAPPTSHFTYPAPDRAIVAICFRVDAFLPPCVNQCGQEQENDDVFCHIILVAPSELMLLLVTLHPLV